MNTYSEKCEHFTKKKKKNYSTSRLRWIDNKTTRNSIDYPTLFVSIILLLRSSTSYEDESS